MRSEPPSVTERGYGLDDVAVAQCDHQVEGVLGAGQLGEQNLVAADPAQARDELAGVLDQRRAVLVAVQEEERRRVAAPLQRGRSGAGGAAVVTGEPDHGGDRRVRGLETRLELRVARG